MVLAGRINPLKLMTPYWDVCAAKSPLRRQRRSTPRVEQQETAAGCVNPPLQSSLRVNRYHSSLSLIVITHRYHSSLYG